MLVKLFLKASDLKLFNGDLLCIAQASFLHGSDMFK